MVDVQALREYHPRSPIDDLRPRSAEGDTNLTRSVFGRTANVVCPGLSANAQVEVDK
jgi:hypothetical protein